MITLNAATHTLPLGSHTLSVEVLGKGDPILCLSGFGCDHYNFLELAKDLEDHFQLFLLDNRGMGKSSAVSRPYSMMDLARDGLAVMDHFKVNRFHLIGISMGGFIAQLMATHFPERVISQGLLCTTAPGNEYSPLPFVDKEGLETFYSLEPKKAMTVAVEATVHPNFNQRNREGFQRIVQIRLDHPAHCDQVLLQKEMVDHYLKGPDTLPSFKVPTFILSGENDRFVDPRNALLLSQKWQAFRTEFIPESDHLFFLEKPREVGKIVVECLKENP